MHCEIVYQNIGERWGIFPKDIGEFQARICQADSISKAECEDTIIKKSGKIEIMSCSFSPDENNRRHQKALNDLVEKLIKAGWEPLADQGAEWYSLRFCKKDSE
jgi:hypothetical protein